MKKEGCIRNKNKIELADTFTDELAETKETVIGSFSPPLTVQLALRQKYNTYHLYHLT